MGFYADAAIQPRVARIRHREDHIIFSHHEAASRKAGPATDQMVAGIIESTLQFGPRETGAQYQVFLLSGPEDPETIHLAQPIVNDTISGSGRTAAWTRG